MEDGFIKIVFVRTQDNKADVFTKNVMGELHDKHTGGMVWKLSDMEKGRKQDD